MKELINTSLRELNDTTNTSKNRLDRNNLSQIPTLVKQYRKGNQYAGIDKETTEQDESHLDPSLDTISVLSRF